MSHDRGCYVCGAEQWEYKYCKKQNCPKVKPEEEAPEDFKIRKNPKDGEDKILNVSGVQNFAPPTSPIDYKYSEDQSIQELKDHIDSTYSAHYMGDEKIQCWDAWEALGACETSHRDTALKYLWRYGKKNGFNRSDLLKAMHYIIVLLHYNKKFHDKQPGT